jgi:Flp pilus assembly protein TadB
VTTILVLLGCGVGTGASLLLSLLPAKRGALAAEFTRLGALATLAREGSQSDHQSATSLTVRLGEMLLRLVPRVGAGTREVDRDLAVVGRTRSQYATDVSTAAVVAAASIPVAAAAASLVGIGIPVVVPVAGFLAIGLAGAAIPVIRLRSKADDGRRHFRRALSCWLDLVALAQAGGMGLESALQAASSIAGDPVFGRLQRTIEVSRHSGRTPWDGLARLGDELGISDLEELGASLALAGTEGARIRSSLSAKSTSLRGRELAESEAEANSVTERLFLPSVVLMLGFLLFIGYPAVVTISHTL